MLYRSPAQSPSPSTPYRAWKQARLQTEPFQFRYTFESGHKLVGELVGDRLLRLPHLVFNLRRLNAICISPNGQQLLTFNTVFGQFNLDFPGAIFSGTHDTTGSCFSFNYRGLEATIYDAIADEWVATGWCPAAWSVEGKASTDIARVPQLPVNYCRIA